MLFKVFSLLIEITFCTFYIHLPTNSTTVLIFYCFLSFASSKTLQSLKIYFSFCSFFLKRQVQKPQDPCGPPTWTRQNPEADKDLSQLCNFFLVRPVPVLPLDHEEVEVGTHMMDVCRKATPFIALCKQWIQIPARCVVSREAIFRALLWAYYIILYNINWMKIPYTDLLPHTNILFVLPTHLPLI